MWGFQGRVAVDGEHGEGSTVNARFSDRDEWVYIQRVDGRIRIWTGKACSQCSVDLLSVRRCEIHSGLVLVAVQCRLL